MNQPLMSFRNTVVEQQKEIVSLLKTMMGQSSNPVTSVPAATHVQQSSGATHH